MSKSMPTTFILSLDCEGKWGMADSLTPSIRHLITNESLKWAYRSLLELLDQYEIQATFAVVGLFAGDYDNLLRYREYLDSSPAHRLWMKCVWMELSGKSSEGWFSPTLIERIQKSGSHEIASHSFSHVPFNMPEMTDDSRCVELSLMRSFGVERGIHFETFVYPRNSVVQPELLGDYGLNGFRASQRVKFPATLVPLYNFLSEHNVLQRSYRHARLEHPITIPSGVFLNWRNGLRRFVPIKITLIRLRHLLQHAEQTNGVAHVWFHPHNMVTAESQIELVRAVLDMVAAWQKDERITIMTQAQYCCALAGTGDKNERL
jgi:peptidoglycan/xylan/chitin deacetylase (PgdA/CDA1 family)